MTKSGIEHKRLVLILHAFTLGPESLSHVQAVVAENLPDAHVLAPRLPLEMFSTADPSDIASGMLTIIDEQVHWRESQGWRQFEEILLIGHSYGALIARKVYVLCASETRDARLSSRQTSSATLQGPRPWADLVTRIILLAGMNRGWSITHHLSIRTAALLFLGSIVGNALLTWFGKRLAIFQIRRGAPFITELRLQWLALQQSARKADRRVPVTIQLLGTIDDLVSPDDNIDLVTGREFLYLDVPHSGHVDVIEMGDTEYGRHRRAVFELALKAHPDVIRARAIVPSDHALPDVRPEVTNVVFVIHGIRDAGYWTHKIARKAQAMGSIPPRVYSTETSTYGYFPMFPFLLPGQRWAKVEWLMDQYVEAKALYPNAQFSSVGHSNGTYLLASALTNYRGCRFDNLVLAGSVVRSDFDWKTLFDRGQVKAILNYVATADWVVAWFPGVFEQTRLQDLGSAGHNGFTQASRLPDRGSEPSASTVHSTPDAGPRIFERRYVRGGHSAALCEENWNDIAHFVTHGEPLVSCPLPTSSDRHPVVVALGWFPPLVWIGIVGILWVVGSAIWHLHLPEYQRTIAVALFIWAVWKTLTKL